MTLRVSTRVWVTCLAVQFGAGTARGTTTTVHLVDVLDPSSFAIYLTDSGFSEPQQLAAQRLFGEYRDAVSGAVSAAVHRVDERLGEMRLERVPELAMVSDLDLLDDARASFVRGLLDRLAQGIDPFVLSGSQYYDPDYSREFRQLMVAVHEEAAKIERRSRAEMFGRLDLLLADRQRAVEARARRRMFTRVLARIVVSSGDEDPRLGIDLLAMFRAACAPSGELEGWMQAAEIGTAPRDQGPIGQVAQILQEYEASYGEVVDRYLRSQRLWPRVWRAHEVGDVKEAELLLVKLKRLERSLFREQLSCTTAIADVAREILGESHARLWIRRVQNEIYPQLARRDCAREARASIAGATLTEERRSSLLGHVNEYEKARDHRRDVEFLRAIDAFCTPRSSGEKRSRADRLLQDIERESSRADEAFLDMIASLLAETTSGLGTHYSGRERPG